MAPAIGGKQGPSSEMRDYFRTMSIVAAIVFLHIGFILLFALDAPHLHSQASKAQRFIQFSVDHSPIFEANPFVDMPSAKPLMPKAIFPSFDVEPSSIIAPPETQDISVPLSTLAAPKLAQATVAGEMGHLASLGLGARDANGVCHELSQSYLDQLATHMMGNFRLPFYVKRPVILVYAFDQSGKLLRLERVKSSGSDRFDAYIMHHINQISPMPPIPASEHAVFYQDLLVVGFSKHARSKFIDDHCHKLNDDSRLDEGGGPVARGKE